MQALGIDIGGSGIKAALVDLDTGDFISQRQRIDTPKPATPKAVGKVCQELIERLHIPPDLPVGITFPAPLPGGRVPFIANLDQSWVNLDICHYLSQACARPVLTVNDGDAAGYAETLYGSARGQSGVIVVTTLGTGIGSAIIVNGTLVPNTEFGHLEIDGYVAETRAAASARERQNLSWERWAKRLQRYYSELEKLLSPDLFVVGGGVSKKHHKFLPLLRLRAPIVPAMLRNSAGIVGAAALAYQQAHGTHIVPNIDEDAN